jgi:hypothetical protein
MLGWARLDKPRRVTGRRARAVSLAASLALTASCAAAPSSYMGIDLAAPPATAEAAEIQDLAKRARKGDKQAQTDLGIRFEEGRGVEQDFDRALELYTLATTGRDGRYTIFVPTNGAVRAETVSTGEVEVNAEAQKRLSRLVNSPPTREALIQANEQKLGTDARDYIFKSSPHLTYLGKRSEPLFLERWTHVNDANPRLIANFGSGLWEDHEPENNFCRQWERHLRHNIGTGKLASCDVKSFNVINLRTPGNSSATPYIVIEYRGFGNLEAPCEDIHRQAPCPRRPPLSQPIPARTNFCGWIDVHYFQTDDGLLVAMMTNTSHEYYGRATYLINLADHGDWTARRSWTPRKTLAFDGVV